MARLVTSNYTRNFADIQPAHYVYQGLLSGLILNPQCSTADMSQSSDDEMNSSTTSVSPEQRIKELNDIDHDISQLLSYASKAIGQLPNENYQTPNPQLEDVKAEFADATREYYSTLSTIAVKLRRQVYGLEEAGLINHGRNIDAARAASMTENQSSRRAGGGALDSSYLNVKAKDAIGTSMKRQILDEAKQFLEKANINVENKTEDNMHIDT